MNGEARSFIAAAALDSACSAHRGGDGDVRQLDPGQLSSGEMADEIRRQVEQEHVKLILIDSLNGYMNAMQEDKAVLLQLHELLSYLNHNDVLTLITVAQHGLVGDSVSSPLDISYLADTVVLLRYFEAGGAVRKSISVLKKRTGAHEDVIREFKIRGNQLEVGEPLSAFRGVLTGVPELHRHQRESFRSGQ
jgi:circadian clock protein KaiC